MKKKIKTTKSQNKEQVKLLRESAEIVRELAANSPEQLAADMLFAFPECDPGIAPVGNRIVCQIRRPRKKDGNVHLTNDTREAIKWNEMTAKVIALGPLAYKNRQDLSDWPEGPWCKVGDFVRLPKYGGDRIERPVEGQEEPALFVTVEDKNVISKVTCHPLSLKTLL